VKRVKFNFKEESYIIIFFYRIIYTLSLIRIE